MIPANGDISACSMFSCSMRSPFMSPLMQNQSGSVAFGTGCPCDEGTCCRWLPEARGAMMEQRALLSGCCRCFRRGNSALSKLHDQTTAKLNCSVPLQYSQ